MAGSDGQNIAVDYMGGFADANFANPSDPQRRSISGFVCFVFMCCVCWRSKLQTVTAGSTHDAVDVILTDVEQSDWGQGGELFSEKKRD